jgi:ABC-type amino acid transport substrate-binding protein
MTGVFKSAEREKLFQYFDRFVDDNVVVVAKGKASPFAQASDLSGKGIGVQSSFYDGDAFDAVKPQVIVDADSSPKPAHKEALGRARRRGADQSGSRRFPR